MVTCEELMKKSYLKFWNGIHLQEENEEPKIRGSNNQNEREGN